MDSEIRYSRFCHKCHKIKRTPYKFMTVCQDCKDKYRDTNRVKRLFNL